MGEEGYQAAKITFGAQPTDTQIYHGMLKEWHRLVFSKLSEEERPTLEQKQKAPSAGSEKVYPDQRDRDQGPGGSRASAGGSRAGPKGKEASGASGGGPAEIPSPAAKKARKKAGQIILPHAF